MRSIIVLAVLVGATSLGACGCESTGEEARRVGYDNVAEPTESSVTYDLGTDPLFAFGSAPTDQQLIERTFHAVAAPSINIFSQGLVTLQFTEGRLIVSGSCDTIDADYRINREGRLLVSNLSTPGQACNVDEPLDEAVAVLVSEPIIQIRDDTETDGTAKLLLVGDRAGTLLFVAATR